MKRLLDDPAILRELIMDHYQYPRNHQLVQDNQYHTVHMASDSCIDDIQVQAKIVSGVLEDIRFDGVACTIATSSTSMMSELLKGKTVDQAKEIVHQYFLMIDEKPYDEDLLQEAVAMKGVSKQANRIKCATIGWNAIKQIIEESESGS